MASKEIKIKISLSFIGSHMWTTILLAMTYWHHMAALLLDPILPFISHTLQYALTQI